MTSRRSLSPGTTRATRPTRGHLERMHAPEPMTPADAVAFQCAFDHGVIGRGARLRPALPRHDAPHQHLPVPRPGADELARDPDPDDAGSRSSAAIGRLGELWDGEYLPRSSATSASGRRSIPAGAGPAAARRRLDDERRTDEAPVRDPLLDLVPLHVRDQPVRRLLPRRLRRRQRLRRVPLAAGLRQQDGGERAGRCGSSAGGRCAWRPYARCWSTSRPRPSPPRSTATAEGRRFLAALREYLEAWGQRGDRWGWSFPAGSTIRRR